MLSRQAVLLALVTVPLGTGCQPSPMPISQAEVQALQADADLWVTHVLAKDWDALSQLYTEDAVFMPPGQPSLRGRTAIREFMAAFPPLASFVSTIDTITGVGDLAYVRGRYRMTLAAAPGAADSGKYLEIRRKQPDGSWKVTIDIFNSSVPAPDSASQTAAPPTP